MARFESIREKVGFKHLSPVLNTERVRNSLGWFGREVQIRGVDWSSSGVVTKGHFLCELIVIPVSNDTLELVRYSPDLTRRDKERRQHCQVICLSQQPRDRQPRIRI